MRKDRTLSRRERQIMDILYELQEATAQQVLELLPSPPGYSAVRALLRVLEHKGHVGHRQDGPRYVFAPLVARDKARRNALRHLVKTFFDDSAEDAVAALLDLKEENLTAEEYARLEELIRKARREGR